MIKERKRFTLDDWRINMKEQLLKKITEKTITVGVVGLGYVGLPLAV